MPMLELFIKYWEEIKMKKTLYYNGQIHCMDSKNSQVEAIGIEGNKICYLGNKKDGLAAMGTPIDLVDLEGSCVIPGFNDSHLHLLAYGKSLSEVALQNCKSRQDVIQTARDFLIKYPKKEGQWLIGRGWNEEHFDDKQELTKTDLNEISDSIPILFHRACLHTAVANDAALTLASINENTIIQDGKVELHNGKLTGVLREYAVTPVNQAIPKDSKEDKKRAVLLALKKLNDYGITSIHTDDLARDNGGLEMLDIYQELEKEEKLTIRLSIQYRIEHLEDVEFFFKGNFAKRYNSKYIKINALKLLGDGSLGGKTAALNEPYEGSNQKGMLLFTQEELEQIILIAHSHHMPVVIHAIGDRTINMALAAFEKAQKLYPDIKDIRHGIIHCQIMTQRELDKFEKLKVIAYIQPIFLLADYKIVRRFVGEKRERTSYQWKEFLKRGIPLAISTDCPVEDPNPFPNIYCGVARKDFDGKPEEGWMMDQAISISESLYAYTYMGAYASYDESEKGSLEIGKKADFAVLNNDLFTIPVGNIPAIQVKDLIFDGVYVKFDIRKLEE